VTTSIEIQDYEVDGGGTIYEHDMMDLFSAHMPPVASSIHSNQPNPSPPIFDPCLRENNVKTTSEVVEAYVSRGAREDDEHASLNDYQ